MLDDLKLIHQRDSQDLLGTAVRRWAALADTAAWRPQSATSENIAKQLALELLGKSVALYAGNELRVVAYKWKRLINTHAKQLTWTGGLDDDEITGWTGQPVNKQYAVLCLRSDLESDEEQRLFRLAERSLSGRWPAPVMVSAQGKTVAEQSSYCLALGEFVALYLALLNGYDPAKRVS